MAFVLFGFQCGEEGEGVWGGGGAADISLLCKCSFPHKQRGVQIGRVERGESIACVFVSVSPINSSPSSPRQSVAYVRVYVASRYQPSAGGAPSASRRNKPPAARGNQKWGVTKYTTV